MPIRLSFTGMIGFDALFGDKAPDADINRGGIASSIEVGSSAEVDISMKGSFHILQDSHLFRP